MLIKIYFLYSHFSFFPSNFGAVRDEQGEQFHQDVKRLEERLKGRCFPVIIGGKFKFFIFSFIVSTLYHIIFILLFLCY